MIKKSIIYNDLMILINWHCKKDLHCRYEWIKSIWNMINMVRHVIWFHIGKHHINCNWIQASRGRWREATTGI